MTSDLSTAETRVYNQIEEVIENATVKVGMMDGGSYDYVKNSPKGSKLGMLFAKVNQSEAQLSTFAKSINMNPKDSVNHYIDELDNHDKVFFLEDLTLEYIIRFICLLNPSKHRILAVAGKLLTDALRNRLWPWHAVEIAQLSDDARHPARRDGPFVAQLPTLRGKPSICFRGHLQATACVVQ